MSEIERAIQLLKADVRHDVNEHEKYYIDLAISALEKQMLKEIETNDDKDYFKCPNCKFDFMGCGIGECPDYCYKCGQKLDWSDENE